MVRAVAWLSSRQTERVQVFIRRLSLGLDQGTQQHLVSTTFGNPLLLGMLLSSLVAWLLG
jgi:hypothetical protein